MWITLLSLVCSTGNSICKQLTKHKMQLDFGNEPNLISAPVKCLSMSTIIFFFFWSVANLCERLLISSLIFLVQIAQTQ